MEFLKQAYGTSARTVESKLVTVFIIEGEDTVVGGKLYPPIPWAELSYLRTAEKAPLSLRRMQIEPCQTDRGQDDEAWNASAVDLSNSDLKASRAHARR